jgi:hypothetical protein
MIKLLITFSARLYLGSESLLGNKCETFIKPKVMHMKQKYHMFDNLIWLGKQQKERTGFSLLSA